MTMYNVIRHTKSGSMIWTTVVSESLAADFCDKSNLGIKTRWIAKTLADIHYIGESVHIYNEEEAAINIDKLLLQWHHVMNNDWKDLKIDSWYTYTKGI